GYLSPRKGLPGAGLLVPEKGPLPSGRGLLEEHPGQRLPSVVARDEPFAGLLARHSHVAGKIPLAFPGLCGAVGANYIAGHSGELSTWTKGMRRRLPSARRKARHRPRRRCRDGISATSIRGPIRPSSHGI